MTFLAVRAALLAKPKTMRGWIFLAGVCVTLLISALTIWQPVFFRFLDSKIYDTLLRSGYSSNGVKTLENPVIVDIDEQSLARFGQWPWPRYRVAQLLNNIQEQGAASVCLDMFFPEADRTSLDVVREDMRREFGATVDLRGIPAYLTDNDTALSAVLARGPFVLSYDFLFTGKGNASDGCPLHPLQAVVMGKPETHGTPTGLFRATGAVCSLPVLNKAVPSSGFFNVIPDPDGVLRRVPLLIEFNGKLYPSLALATALRSMGTVRPVLKVTSRGLESIVVGDTGIPVDSRANLLIRFHETGRHFTTIPARDFLLNRVPRNRIEGKIVILGSSAAGLEKLHATPLSPILPGAEIHATIIDNILKKEFISRPYWVPGVEFILVLVCGIVSALLLSWTRSILGLSIIVAGGAGLWLTSGWMLGSRGIFVSPLFPLIIFSGNFSLLTFIKYWREEQTVKTRNRELVVMQNFTIQCLAALTETRDSETGRHIERCQHYVRILCNQLASNPKFADILDNETIDLLYRSASLHDIGKVGVPDSILLKPSSLTEDEYREMKKHTLYGREAIERAEHLYGKDVKDSFLQFGKEIAYSHHEKWNGAGYPEGLAGEDIPLFGRIMAVADVYDALICKRRYKPSFTHEEAVEIISRNKGTHFDPVVVEAFLAVQEEFSKVARQLPDE
jgi:adenylate cyclase